MSRIVRADLAHAQVLSAIHASAFPPDAAWSAQAIATQLGVPGVFGLLHTEGGMLLAQVACEQSELLTLAVQPARRRHGFGADLLQAAMQRSARSGAVEMFLEVATNNAAGRALYARAGFTEVGRRPRYYVDGTDALVLRRVITRRDAAEER